jgi:hypothetical protein
VIIPSRLRLPFAAGAMATIVGLAAAWHYHQRGLTLSHYDARGHLIVARRIIDSLTPGWQQIGAVWLPLPHVITLLPTQIDAWYRSGLFAVIVSVLAFGVAAGCLAALVFDETRSAWGAIAGTVVFVSNPNVLYLQATPMTEPLLLALLTAAVLRLASWTRQPWTGGPIDSPDSVGCLFAAACLTRYEAWPVTAAAIPVAVWGRWRSSVTADGSRRPHDFRELVRQTWSLAKLPAGAVAAFLVFSRVVVGEWFVSAGFFVPDPKFAGPGLAAGAIWEGVVALTGPATMAAVLGGALVLTVRALRSVRNPRFGASAVLLTLVATAALPWLAFLQGHPFRVRYMVPLLAAEAVSAGVLVGIVRQAAPAVAMVVLALVAYDARSRVGDAPMVAEAQWERPLSAGRHMVTACLKELYRGETVMASMASLGHYMQELSTSGFVLRDFLHEGNGDIWLNALERPRPYAGWLLVEEVAEGGDMLAQRAHDQPDFLDGFTRVCEGGGVALYQRAPEPDMPPASGAP